MTLAHAQHLIVTNWGDPRPSQPASPFVDAGSQLQRDGAVEQLLQRLRRYVHSNQPNQTVTVRAPDGRSASWHTDSSGYADVYFYDSRWAAGEQVTVRVGGASCYATL
jgi:hypothetical protein